MLNEFLIPVDVEEILKVKVAKRQADDFIAWNMEKNGVFSVPSVYHLVVSEHIQKTGRGLD